MKKLLLLLFLTPLTFADTLTCKVVGINDGNTITCLTDDKVQHKIRLYQIDAPERKQAFGTISRKALSGLIFNKTVEIKTHGKDKYSRTLGTIYDKNAFCTLTKQGCYPPNIRILDVNLEMIKQGMAWYYPFAKKNGGYEKEQAIAKASKVGLWSQKAIAPWEWRKQK